MLDAGRAASFARSCAEARLGGGDGAAVVVCEKESEPFECGGGDAHRQHARVDAVARIEQREQRRALFR
eukprot:109266-Pleurochrysis_carterae.AAC.1